MAQIVKLRRSSVSGQKPTNTNLQLGELAQNTTDGKIFLAKSGSGGPSIEEIIVTNTSNTGSINLLGSVTASNFTGSFIGDGALLYNIPASGVTGLQLDRITSGNVSASISPATGLVINTGVTITGSISATEFTGSGLGLTNVPFHISGSDVDGGTYDKQFTKLQFDDSTGLNVSESVAGTAFISIGSHFRDIFVSGSDMLRATGSDAFEIIPEGGIEVTTSITDTNSNGYVKELRLSTTTLSSSLDTRIDNLSSSVVYQSETSSMTVLSSSYALTASFALNAGAGTEGRTYVHSQTSASTTWTVNHNLGEHYPVITVYDSLDNVIVPTNIIATTDNQIVITFSSAQSGKASVTVGGGLPHISGSYTEYVLATNGTLAYWKGGLISGSSQIILSGTTGYSAFSSSIATTTSNIETRVSSIETTTGSLNSFTSSASGRLTSIETATSSLNSHTTSTDGRLTAIETSTGSLNTFSSSTLTRLSSLETASGSIRTDFNTFTSSYTTVSSSLDSRLDVLEAYSGSQQVPTASFSFRTAETSVYCKNSSGYQINKGQVVRIVGSVGDNPLIATASYENDANSANTLGVAKENIPNDSFGMVITEGVLLGVDTLGMTGGDLLYLGANGSFTTVSPTAPLHGVRLGEVLRVQQNNGSIYVRIDNGIELNEAHDVAYTSISSGDLLVRSGSVWINSKQLTGSYHITGSINATSLTGSIDYNNLTNVPTLVSGSSQILLTGTTGYSTFSSSIATTTSNIETRVGALETESGSIRTAFNSYTSSANGRLNAIETSTGSLNTFSSSTNSRLTSIESSTSSLNSFTSSTSTSLTAIQTSTASLNSFTSSTNTRLGALETESGSIRTAFNSYTSSNDTTNSTQNSRLTALETSTSSLNSFSSSTNSRLSSIETSTGSLNTFSSSTNTRLGALETESGSIRTAFNNYTSSNDGTNTTQNNRLTSLEGKTGSYATTGSNIFIGDQTITGSLYISQNLVIAGSSSIQHITSSQLNIGDNIITVNAQNPSIRFGGLAVIDSGSSPQVSGSILFDSTNDQWVFVHQNQGTITSSVFLMGPETYNNLGGEGYLTQNRIPKGSGIEHLYDSNITDTGTKVSINSNTEITGTFVVTGTALVSGSSQIDHNSTTNYVANEHINHTSVSISAGNGLSGGGDISATRTLTLDTGSAHFTGGVKSKMNTDGVVSSSAQVVAALPSGTVSGSSQVLNGSGVWSGSAQLPAGVVSGSSQVSFSGLSGVPSGLVSGSSQVSYTGLSNIPSGIVSGSSQVSFSGLSGVPAGLVSGSSQIDHNSTTNYVANQHIDHTTVSISAGNGLSGGGTIAATRTLTLDTGSAHFVSGARNLISVSDTTGASGIDLTYTAGTGVLSGTLVNSAITIAGNSVSLGGTITAATILTSTGVWSGSAQLPAGTVSGSSQVLNGSGVWSGSAQLPSGVVSGSSQIIAGLPSGTVSGSSQISFGSISGIPSGIVSGSSQLTGSYDSRYIMVTAGDQTISSGGNDTTLRIRANDGGRAILIVGQSANGSQTTGAVEVTQDGNYGGGISYNGDGTPSFVSGETADNVTFYRINNGTRSEVFHYSYDSDTVNFNAAPTVSSNTILHAGNYTSYAMQGAGYSANQNLNTTDSPTFAGMTLNGLLTGNRSAGLLALNLATNDNYASMRVIANQVTSGVNSDGMYIGYQNGNSGVTRIFGGGASSGGIVVNGSGVNNVTIAGNIVLNAGNYTSYAMQGAGYSANQNLNTTSSPTFDSPYFSGAVSHNTSSSRNKYNVYGSGGTYCIGMQSSITFGGLEDWGMTFQFNNDDDRGFWWGDESHSVAQGAMALTTNGYLTVARRIRVGYGESDTSTPSIPLQVYGSSGTVFDVQGASGQLFSVTDDLTGDIFSVSDISGIPFINVNTTNGVSFGSTVFPSVNNTYDLGTSSYRWANVYTNDLHLSNEGKEGGNDVDGTTGNWTIQEGSEQLYIINNKNGKKYKINLTEID